MKRNISGRVLVALVAVVLLIGCAAGGTVAWLVSKPAAIVNTFTIGDIKASLAETTKDYHIVPGVDIAKDPVATVVKNSEDCYLFVKIVEENWPNFTETGSTTRKVDYAVAAGWTKLEDGVYYREVGKSADDQAFHILKDDKVTVSSSLTKGELSKVATQPKLTFTVYAVQRSGVDTPAAAWALTK